MSDIRLISIGWIEEGFAFWDLEWDLVTDRVSDMV